MVRIGGELAAAITFVGVCVGTLLADDPTAAKNYGAGVHDYYQGRYSEALLNLDTAIALETRDPRMYFFRGLAKQRLGYVWDAEVDFQLGAQLEIALKRRDVGRALQRIQGPDRLKIERFRREASQLPPDVVQQVVPPRAEPLVQRRLVPKAVRPANASSVVTELAPDGNDPFRDDAEGFLGQGAIQTVVDATKPPTARSADEGEFAEGFGDQGPFGSGVVAEAESNDDVQDPFAMGDDSSDGSDDAGQPSGPVGAAIRAFSRAVSPTAVTDQSKQLLDRVRGGAANAPGDPFAAPTDGSSPQDSAADDPFAAPADDPFAPAPGASDAPESDDPFATPAPADTDSSTPQDASADDPFAEPPADTESVAPQADAPEDPFQDDDPFNFE